MRRYREANPNGYLDHHREYMKARYNKIKEQMNADEGTADRDILGQDN